MALKIGIVGLPNVGKSTLFNALTKTHAAQAANYPFCTIDPNIGIVEVPDERLVKLTEIVRPEKVIPAAIEFVDIAGLVRGASKGEGLGNAFLSHIREVDAICHVIRGFTEGDVIHVEGSVDPLRDRGTIEMELALADIQSLSKRLDKTEGAARTGDKAKILELAVGKKLIDALNEGKLASSVSFSPKEEPIAHGFQLLTMKQMIYALNVAESELATINAAQAAGTLKLGASTSVIVISAKIEEDLQTLSSEEAAAFLNDLNVDSSGLDRLIRAAYAALGLITYFTAGPKEVRAWTVKVGSTAPKAAGVIHSDFEKGFIRAETISYKDFVQYGGETEAKNAGKLRLEGKDYVTHDGDIFHFRFQP